MAKSKRSYRKGMEFFHQSTKKKILFGQWNKDGSAFCLTQDKEFLNVPRDVLDSEYISYSELEKDARERRRGQAW